MNKIAAVLFILLFLSLCLYSDSSGTRTTEARKVEEAMIIDGLLDEAAWETAVPIEDFIQFEPDQGKPISFETTAWVLYDEDHLYVGFRCVDPDPQKIAASITKRDGEGRQDDLVSVWLDTFHDKRRCYIFATNLLGTQLDVRITDNGKTADMTWDGIWESAARRTEYGYSVEIAINLVSIKYQPGENMTWGFNVGRIIPRFLELGYWAGPLEHPWKVSQYGELTGLDLMKSQKKIQLIPHIIGKVQEGQQTDIEAGLDGRYAFSQMISGHFTVNPDFATIEADQEEINLTRFEVNLPEKRNFFLEGSEIYSQRIRLFYTRRIGDIYGGARVYGKAGSFEVSALSVQTRKDEQSEEDSANFSVFRIKKDVLKSSMIGFLAANKIVNGVSMGTAGLDTAIYFSDTFKFTGQLAMSYGEQDTKNIGFFLRPSYDSNTFHIHLRYTQLGEFFGDNANSVGFIRDDNRRELDSSIEKTFWIRKWGIDRMEYGSNYNIYWGMDDTLRSWRIDQEISLDLKNKFSFDLEHMQEYKLYEKDFRNHQTEFSIGYNTREWQSVRVSYSYGKNYDADFHLYEGSLRVKITSDFSLSYAFERLILDPDPEIESTWIHVIRATNYFTKDLFLKVFYQAHTSIDKQNIQVLFVYRFQPPFGLIQIAYQKGTGRFGERGAQGHTLFLKIAYMF